jgi:putative chitinase
VKISEEILKKVFPKAPADKIKAYAPAFETACGKMGFDTPKRIAALMGQIAVESGELRYDRELPSKYNKKDPGDKSEPTGTLYEGRKLLGNTQPGDGPLFIGRGVLQLTGRENYTLYGKKLGIDLVGNPELACDPTVSVQIACQYFLDRKLHEAADRWDLDTITLRVNGKAKLHHDKRVEYSERAKKALEALPNT